MTDETNFEDWSELNQLDLPWSVSIRSVLIRI